MPARRRVVVDDRLLIEELLVGLRPRRRVDLHTTAYWYYRACRAAVVAAGGHLSGPFARLPSALQDAAVMSLLELRADIGLPDPREIVPAMADLARRHPQLNLLNIEAVAAAQVLSASLWLSEPAARGVLPSVVDEERVRYEVISL